MPDIRRTVLARIDALGTAEVARLVAPAWGCSEASAASRLSRWRAHVEGRRDRSARDLTSEPFCQLLAVLWADDPIARALAETRATTARMRRGGK